MKHSRILAHWPFFVDVIEDDRVFLRIKDDGDDAELEMPLNRFFKMFGRRHLQQGRYGTIVIKQRADSTVGMRGWPYCRKWTQAEIDAIEAQADKLWKALHDEAPQASPSPTEESDEESDDEIKVTLED